MSPCPHPPALLLAALALVGVAGCGSGPTAATGSGTASSPAPGGSGSAAAASAAATSSAADELPSSETVAADLRAALRGAKSVHMVMDGTEGGKPLHVDLRGPVKGPDAHLVIDQNGEHAEMIRLGAKGWARMTSPGKKPTVWFPMPRKDLDQITGEKGFGGVLTELDRTTEQLVGAQVARSIQGGTPVLVLTDPQDTSSSMVLREAKPRYPLKFVVRDEGRPATMVFDQWDAVPPIVAPVKG